MRWIEKKKDLVLLLFNATFQLHMACTDWKSHVLIHGHTRTHTSTVQQSEHKPQGSFRGEREGDGDDEECLKSTKDLHRQSHDTLRKPKSVLAFISDTKRETVQKSSANFAESLRQKTKKLHCLSYSKWTFHMRIDGKLYFFSIL